MSSRPTWATQTDPVSNRKIRNLAVLYNACLESPSKVQEEWLRSRSPCLEPPREALGAWLSRGVAQQYSPPSKRKAIGSMVVRRKRDQKDLFPV